MSFKFNNQTFEVVEENGEKLVFKEKKEIDLSRMTEILYSYNLLGALQRGKGKELIERAEEALRIQSFLWIHYSDVSLYRGAKLHVYHCFKELDDFLQVHKDDFTHRKNIIENSNSNAEEIAKGVHVFNME